eukprot:SAG22_NODE_933_length_6434_cov_5.195264_8_plen_104_part_01
MASLTGRAKVRLGRQRFLGHPAHCMLADMVSPCCVLHRAGTCVRPIAVQNGGDWGLGQWSPMLLALLFDASNRNVNMQMTNLMGERYYRLNTQIEEDIQLDEVT